MYKQYTIFFVVCLMVSVVQIDAQNDLKRVRQVCEVQDGSKRARDARLEHWRNQVDFYAIVALNKPVLVTTKLQRMIDDVYDITEPVIVSYIHRTSLYQLRMYERGFDNQSAVKMASYVELDDVVHALTEKGVHPKFFPNTGELYIEN